MFDFGFSEVLLTSVIALIVLGPEKLPRAASQVGRWVGRARAMARQFREQLEEEVNLENVKKAHKEEEARKETEAKQGGGTDGAAGTSQAAGQSSTPGPGMDPTQSATTGQDTAAGQGEAMTGHDTAVGQASDASGVTAGQSASSTGAPFGDQISPDPAEFRADTFSHAHPTDDFGANPLTANGAAPEPTPPPAALGTAHDASSSVPSDLSGAATPSTAPAPRPQDPGTSAPHRPEGGEAYASATATVSAQVPPAASETATDAHSTTPPEKSGPA